jgi:hypothetical protein
MAHSTIAPARSHERLDGRAPPRLAGEARGERERGGERRALFAAPPVAVHPDRHPRRLTARFVFVRARGEDDAVFFPRVFAAPLRGALVPRLLLAARFAVVPALRFEALACRFAPVRFAPPRRADVAELARPPRRATSFEKRLSRPPATFSW